MPLLTLSATVDANGISAPSYAEILQSLQESFRIIYGSDAYIEPDSQDGQLLAIFALCINDANQTAIKVFNSFNPTYSQGTDLSSLVKINGIARAISTYSTSDGLVVGQVGSVITDGVVADENGNLWDLPTPVVIPLSGDITVTVTAQDAGAVIAPVGTINKISTPTRGWQSFTSTSDAVAGEPVEEDGQLRQRQTSSTALPSLSVFDGTIGAVKAIAGVGKVKGYENDTGSTDADGIPEHSISIVAESGDSQEIGNAIAIKKTPGTGTFGTTSVVALDKYGTPNTINFYRPTVVTLGVEVSIKALLGFITGYTDTIKQAIVDYVTATLDIGSDVYITRLYAPANLYGLPEGFTFEVTLVRIKKNAGAFGVSDIPVAFNELATTPLTSVTVIILP